MRIAVLHQRLAIQASRIRVLDLAGDARDRARRGNADTAHRTQCGLRIANQLYDCIDSGRIAVARCIDSLPMTLNTGLIERDDFNFGAAQINAETYHAVCEE